MVQLVVRLRWISAGLAASSVCAEGTGECNYTGACVRDEVVRVAVLHDCLRKADAQFAPYVTRRNGNEVYIASDRVQRRKPSSAHKRRVIEVPICARIEAEWMAGGRCGDSGKEEKKASREIAAVEQNEIAKETSRPFNALADADGVARGVREPVEVGDERAECELSRRRDGGSAA